MSDQYVQPQIPLDQIKINPAALRTAKVDDQEFTELVDSIKLRGVLQPITVRKIVDADTGAVIYGLVDGAQRTEASKRAGRTTIPAHVIDVEEGDALEAQIVLNATRVTTKPVEYAKALQRVLSLNPNLTMTVLANRLAKTASWLSNLLGILKLDESIATVVNEGKMPVSNAYVLARLPKEHQLEFAERAMTMAPAAFAALCQQAAKDLRQKAREGAPKERIGFVLVPHVRKPGELKAVLEDHKPAIDTLRASGVGEDQLQGFLVGVQYALSIDKLTHSTLENEYNQIQEKKAAERAAREAEKKAKKEEEAKRILGMAN